MKLHDRKVAQVFKSITDVQIGLKPGEHVLIVADPDENPVILEALTWAIGNTGAVPTLMIQPNVGWDPLDVYALTEPIKKAYVGADVVISATFSSNSACYGRPQEFRDAHGRGEKHRIFFLGLRTLDVLLDDAETDYYEVKRINDKMKELLLNSKPGLMRIVTDNGTDFQGDLVGVNEYLIIRGCMQNGFAVEPGQFSGRPEGEVHMPPRPESMEGTLVVDGPIANITDHPDEPVRITVKQGKIIHIEGGEAARELERFLSSFDINQHYTSEIAIGTNRSMREKGRTEMGAKRGFGNFHVAYGGWWGKQDKIPYRVHGDMVMKWTPGSKYFLDGKVLFENGEFTFDY